MLWKPGLTDLSHVRVAIVRVTTSILQNKKEPWLFMMK